MRRTESRTSLDLNREYTPETHLCLLALLANCRIAWLMKSQTRLSLKATLILLLPLSLDPSGRPMRHSATMAAPSSKTQLLVAKSLSCTAQSQIFSPESPFPEPCSIFGKLAPTANTTSKTRTTNPLTTCAENSEPTRTESTGSTAITLPPTRCQPTDQAIPSCSSWIDTQ